MGLLLDVIEHVGMHGIQKMFRFMHKQDVKNKFNLYFKLLLLVLCNVEIHQRKLFFGSKNFRLERNKM